MEKIKDNYTMIELQRLIDILIDNKVVKRKLIEKSETQYFYALEKKKYFKLIERGKTEKIENNTPLNPPLIGGQDPIPP